MRPIDADALLEKVEKIQPWDAYLGEYAQGIRHCMELVSLLIQDAPTIEPDPCEDAISRKDAIEEVISQPPEPHYPEWYASQIKELPSAQPEIIRCKDCKHWMPYDWIFSEVWQSKNMNDYPEKEIGCAYCDMNMGANDFCSRAERREDAND